MKNVKKKYDMKTEKKGITLIALVITIIVLLILAGVTIAALSGDNGILINAAKAKEQTEIENEKEGIKLAVNSAKISSAEDGKLTYDNLNDAIAEQFDGNAILKEENNMYSVSFNDLKRTYRLDLDGNIIEINVKVIFLDGYNQVLFESNYDNNARIEQIQFPTLIPSRLGHKFENWSMPDGSNATSQNILDFIKNADTSTTLTISPQFTQIDEYYSIEIADMIFNEDYKIYVNDEEQEQNRVKTGTTVVIELNETSNFSYWIFEDKIVSYEPSLKWKVFKNTEFKVVEDGVVEKKPVINCVYKNAFVDGNTNKISFSFFRSIPDDMEVVEMGVVYSADTEETIENMTKIPNSNKNRVGLHTMNVTVRALVDREFFMRGYCVVKNSDGEQETIYSETASGSFNSILKEIL